MRNRKISKTRVMTIVHGLSEYRICCTIRSNLRIKHEIIARDKGKSSIQINSIMNVLNDNRFRTFNNFLKYFPDVERTSKKQLINFQLFIIMDVDDCSKQMKLQYLNKDLFVGHWLYNYIIPIYNDPNLEETMKQAGIQIRSKKNYIEIFPTNHGDLNIEIAQEFLETIRKCRCTNLDKYIEYCLSIV